MGADRFSMAVQTLDPELHVLRMAVGDGLNRTGLGRIEANIEAGAHHDQDQDDNWDHPLPQ